MRKLLLVLPNLNTSGGVSAYWKSLLSEFRNYDTLKIETFEIGGHGKNLLGPLMDQWHLHQKMKNEFDIAFLNPSLGPRSFFRDALFARQLVKKKVPFVVFFHGWSLEFEKKVDDKYIGFFLKTFGKARKIFVLSQDFKNKIIEWGYQGDVVVETTNVDSSLIIDFSIENKIADLQTTDKIKILFLARLLREKGIFETVEAFRNLSKKYVNLELTIAGDGKDFAELKEAVKHDTNIEIVGHVEGQHKIDLFKENDIYCLPSYSEGLPTSVLEAMAFGMPVITTNAGGLKEFFQDEEMGYLTEPKNVKQLEEKLELLLSNRDKMSEIGNYNYHYAEEKLLNTVVAKRIYSCIEELLGENTNAI